MNQEQTPALKVTQADRDAAADVWRDYVARVGEVIVENAFRAGRSDDSCLVQAFARHRTPDPAVAGLVEALKGLIAAIEQGNLYDTMCCSGHHCGCRGSSVADVIIYDARQALKTWSAQ